MSDTTCDVCDKYFNKKDSFNKHNNSNSLCLKNINCKDLYREHKKMITTINEYRDHIAELYEKNKKLEEENLELKIHNKILSQKDKNYKQNLEDLFNLNEKKFFIEKSKEKYDDLYDYTIVNYMNKTDDIKIICKDHGVFNITPLEHLEGYGCHKCNKCHKCNSIKKIYENKCDICGPIALNIMYEKTKENEVIKYINENIDKNIITNKSVGIKYTGSALYPDIRIECDKYQIIIEIDEFQHNSYKCEEQRMYDIIAKVNQPCIFIRYNPDNKDSDKKILLEKVKKYLDLKENDIHDLCNDYGFFVEYLFYD